MKRGTGSAGPSTTIPRRTRGGISGSATRDLRSPEKEAMLCGCCSTTTTLPWNRPKSIEDSIVLKRPGSAPAKRLNVTPLKRRPQSATVGKPASELHGLEEINVHETHLEPQLRRIRGLLEADAQRGKPTFIKQNLHLPPTRGRLHKLAFKAGDRRGRTSAASTRARGGGGHLAEEESLWYAAGPAGAVRPSSAFAVRQRPSSAPPRVRPQVLSLPAGRGTLGAALPVRPRPPARHATAAAGASARPAAPPLPGRQTGRNGRLFRAHDRPHLFL